MSTHFINESYLGPNLGWRRIEPETGTSIALPADSFLIIHKNTSENENDRAFHHSPWCAPGVPFMSVVENLNDPTANVTFLPAPTTFPDCPFEGCNNRAQHLVDLYGSQKEMDKIFGQARKSWQHDLYHYLKTGAIEPYRKKIRNQALSIQTTEDLKTMIAMLEALNKE